MLSSDQLVRTTAFKVGIACVKPFLHYFWRVQVKSEYATVDDGPIIYLAKHSSHNFEILIMAVYLYLRTGRPVRGIGHYFIRYMCPHFAWFGMEVGTRSNVDWLLSQGESVCILPGGQEEMVGLWSDRSYSWMSMSGRPRYGFAEFAIKHNATVIPLSLVGVESMRFAPILFLLEWTCRFAGLKTFQHYYAQHVIAFQKNWIYANILVLLYVIASAVLVVPIPRQLRLDIGTPLAPRKDETKQSFALRCYDALH